MFRELVDSHWDMLLHKYKEGTKADEMWMQNG